MKTEPIPQMRFDFMDWKECFRVWNENLEQNEDNMRLVISTHWASSGYWIEDKERELTMTDIVYETNDEVQALKKRIEAEIALAVIELRSPRFTT